MTPDNEDRDEFPEMDGQETVCIVCGEPLMEPGGCGGTGMCGPCCTGDASTVGEY